MPPPEPPSIRLLGPTEVTRGTRPVPLPRSQKTRALLAYLAVTGRPHRRERLSSMFWDITDDPRGALRWSLSKLRALDDPGAPRIVADRETVAFVPGDAYIDVLDVRRATAQGIEGLDIPRLEALTSTFRGGLLDGVELPDFDEFQAWRAAERTALRGIHERLLRELITRLAAHPERATEPARELVRLSPEDERARATLVRLLADAGRRDEAEEHYHLGLRHIERLGADLGELRETFRQVTSRPPAAREAADADVARQEVRLCTSPDGTHIAYATLGQGPPLVKTANWMSHLEYDWKCPLWRHLARDLSRDFRLVRYDQRGNGLSDREVEDFSLDACVADLKTVVDEVGLERFPLLGISQGCRVSVAFALAYPERVTHLVLYGGGARGWKRRRAGARATRGGLQPLIREGWGRDTPAFRQVFTTLFMPGAGAEQARWFNELQRVSCSAEVAYRITEAAGEWDVSDRLGEVRAPTLVMHATQDAMVPFEEGRILAAGVPGARFVALESQNHLLLDDEPAYARFVAELRSFLGPDGEPA